VARPGEALLRTIAALEAEAGAAGDDLTVRYCRAARRGDHAAIQRVLATTRDTAQRRRGPR
jgi:hypothetical protein